MGKYELLFEDVYEFTSLNEFLNTIEGAKETLAKLWEITVEELTELQESGRIYDNISSDEESIYEVLAVWENEKYNTVYDLSYTGRTAGEMFILKEFRIELKDNPIDNSFSDEDRQNMLKCVQVPDNATDETLVQVFREYAEQELADRTYEGLKTREVVALIREQQYEPLDLSELLDWCDTVSMFEEQA